MRSARDGMAGEMNIMMDCEVSDEDAIFEYLGSLPRLEADVQQRVLVGRKSTGSGDKLSEG